MENSFEIVHSIQIKKYHVFMSIYEVRDIIEFALKAIDTLNRIKNSYSRDNESQIFSGGLIQIVQKIAVKKEKLLSKKIVKFTFTPVEIYCLRKLVDMSTIKEMPLQYGIIEQIDKQVL